MRAVFLRNEPTRDSFFCFTLASIWREATVSVFFALFGGPSFGNGFNRGNGSTLGREDIEREGAVFAAVAGAPVALEPVRVVADNSAGEVPGTAS